MKSYPTGVQYPVLGNLAGPEGGRMRKTNKPIVRNDFLAANDARTPASQPERVGSRRWTAWLGKHQEFVFKGSVGHLTARREIRRGSAYWYAYRRRSGKLNKIYLGKSEALTLERLEQASARLAGETVRPRLSPQPESMVWLSLPSPLPDAAIVRAGEADRFFLPLTKIH